MRGDLDEAVWEAVRNAGGFAATDIGVELMRKAFHAADELVRS
jgi:hypothetical protein